MKCFKKKELIEKLGLSNEDAKLIMDYQKRLPILNEVGDGFCVDARELHKELGVGRDFTTWIKARVSKYKIEENKDYIVKIGFHQNGGKGGRPTSDYLLTLDTAKELALVENNDIGRVARRYFIKVEDSLKNILEWNRVRNLEKTNYKMMCKELDEYMLRNKGKNARFFDYSNEADKLNQICLGAKAKDIRDYFEAQDKITRDHLFKEYNEYLDKMQELDIMYLRMNMKKEMRYTLIQQGFKAMYPHATFVVADKDDEDNFKKVYSIA